MTGPATRHAPVAAAPSSGGGVTVATTGAALVAAAAAGRERAEAAGLPAALVARDPTLWGAQASPGASARLGWLGAVASTRALLPEVERLRDALRADGVDRVVLCATGGPASAAQAVCAAAGVPLVVLDSTDPGEVRRALSELERTVVVVSSPPAAAPTTAVHLAAARAALSAAGLDPAARVVVVSFPGSPTEAQARDEGSRAVLLADADVGARYSALTAYALVPAGLAGADLPALLDQAAALEPTLDRPDGPALALGAVLGGAAVDGHDKLVLAVDASLPGLGQWVEQLVAGSTGKQGKGVLPVLVEDADAPGTEPAADSHLVLVHADGLTGPAAPHTAVTGPLGAQLLAWEFATAVACQLLQVDPFDEPDDVPLEQPPAERPPLFVEDGIEVRATGDLLAEVSDLDGALTALLQSVPERGWLSVLAFLDRSAEADAARVRPQLAARLAHPVTFGWAPRVLHSAGQLHRDGPLRGAYLLVTGDPDEDLEVAVRGQSFGRVQAAQARAELDALADLGRPVLSLHLADRSAGLATLLRATGG